jgi:hypothetical protein
MKCVVVLMLMSMSTVWYGIAADGRHLTCQQAPSGSCVKTTWRRQLYCRTGQSHVSRLEYSQLTTALVERVEWLLLSTLAVDTVDAVWHGNDISTPKTTTINQSITLMHGGAIT